MDADELRVVWQQENQQVNDQLLNSNDIKAMIREKSNSTLEHIKRAFYTKMWTSTIIGVFAVIMASLTYLDKSDDSNFFNLLNREQFSFMLLMMGLIVFSYGLYLYDTTRKISSLIRSSSALKLMLKRSKKMVVKVMQLGTYADAIGVPFFTTFVLFITLYHDQAYKPDAWALLLLPLAYFLHLLIRNLMYKHLQGKYGHFVNTLDHYLKELQEEK